MNKNVTPIILLVLAIGIYFTFTKGKIDEIKAVRSVNANYEQALANSEKLIKVRDSVLKTFNNIDENDRIRLDKMLPDNIDNVRLIIDVKEIGLKNGLILKNVRTSAPTAEIPTSNKPPVNSAKVIKANNATYDAVTLSFNVSTSYEKFIQLIKALESSLRIIDISRINVNANDTNTYEFSLEMKTYWLKQ